MHLLIRCDATHEGGAGHLVRSIAIAEVAIGRGWQVSFSGDFIEGFPREVLARVPVSVYPAASAPRDLRKLADQIKPDIVHVDNYEDWAEFRNSFASSSALTSSVEDGEFGRRPADLVFDLSPGSECKLRPEDGSPRVFSGADYIPLRTAVRDLIGAGQKKEEERQRSLVVMMGGTDAFGSTGDVLRMLKAFPTGWNCVVISRRNAWDQLRTVTNEPCIQFIEPTESAINTICAADAVIVGSGTTVWELAAWGVPAGVIELTANQHDNYCFIVDGGFVQGLGSLEQIREDDTAAAEALAELLASDDLRARMSELGPRLIDGKGAERIVACWEKALELAPGWEVRRATASDATLLFRWRNDDSTRIASRSTGFISWDDHVAWVERVLTSVVQALYIVLHDGVPVATTRFDVVDHDPSLHEVSITVGPHHRGKGYAVQVLAAAEREFLRENGQNKYLLAFMRAENSGSRRLFESSGYQLTEVAEAKQDLLLFRKKTD